MPLFSAHEDVEVLFLKFDDQILAISGGGGAYNGGEPGRGAVNELDASLPEDDIVGGAQPDVVVCNVFFLGIKIRKFQIADSLDQLFRK